MYAKQPKKLLMFLKALKSSEIYESPQKAHEYIDK